MPLYSSDWPEITQIIKEDAHWECQNCGHPHDPRHGYTLTVHHIDLNSLNNTRYNLVALCQRCHLHYQHEQKRDQLSFFGMPIWLKNYSDAVRLNSSPSKQLLPPKLS